MNIDIVAGRVQWLLERDAQTQAVTGRLKERVNYLESRVNFLEQVLQTAMTLAVLDDFEEEDD